MTEPTIQCPRCKCPIKLTESLAAPLVESTRRQFELKLAEQQNEISKREAAIRQQQAVVAQEKQAIDQQVNQKLAAERKKVAVEESAKARMAIALDLEKRDRDLAELKELLKVRDEKLAEAQKIQADLIRKERALDDARREIDLTIEKTVNEKLAGEREKAKKDATTAAEMEILQLKQTISAMKQQLDEAKRKSEQGSEQLFGEVLEIKLEAMLREKFPRDLIEPVPRGECGGDVVHRVLTPLGHVAGTILWESKRTKRFEESWLPKLRDDQRAAHADLAVIISQTMPRGVENFDLCDGVVITDIRCAMAIATILRQSLLDLSAARQAGEGQNTKVELMYRYLTGPRFRQRVQAIVEKFTDMRDDLDKERKFFARQWAKREVQINNVIESTAGMYGDLQGIAGQSLAEIEGLDVKMLDVDGEERKS